MQAHQAVLTVNMQTGNSPVYWDIDTAPDTAVSERLDNEPSARKTRQGINCIEN